MSDERDPADALVQSLTATLGDGAASLQPAQDGVPTLWLARDVLPRACALLQAEGAVPFVLLDLHALDDALGGHGAARAITLVYSVLRLAPFAPLRLKVRLDEQPLAVQSVTPFFPNADWYERDLRTRANVSFQGQAEGAALPAEALAALSGAEELDVDVDLPRVLALEALLGVAVPPRADAIRVLRCELLRVASHLSWYSAFVEAVGALAPGFYAAQDARRVLEVCFGLGGEGPQRFVVGGVQRDLTRGLRQRLEALLEEMRLRAHDYAEMALASSALQLATKGVSPMGAATTAAWGVTGPVLRAAGLSFDVRKAHPYCGYERYDFEVPAGAHGDLYDRVRVRLDELRQSLRVLEQCVATLPEGPVATPAPRTLVPGEAMALVESSRGVSACYVASDGASLFIRQRTPSFAHLQAAPALTFGANAANVDAIVTSIDIAPSRGRPPLESDYGAPPG